MQAWFTVLLVIGVIGVVILLLVLMNNPTLDGR